MALTFEILPAALINFAAAFSVASVMRQNGLESIAAPTSVLVGIAVFLLVWFVLRRIGGAAGQLALPFFEAAEAQFEEDQEAEHEDCSPDLEEVLTGPFAPVAVEQPSLSGELLLDDILAELTPESRVVRLFDLHGMPTAGELQSRIDLHLRSAPSRQMPPDATAELHEAIRALRQSLR